MSAVPLPVTLTLQPEGATLHARLHDGRKAPLRGTARDASLTELERLSQQLQAPGQAEAALRQAELTVGGQLAALLQQVGMQDILLRLGDLRARAAAEGAELVVLLDGPEALPWELLERTPLLSGARVVRMGGRAPARIQRGAELEVLVWSDQPDVQANTLRVLEALLAPLPHVVRITLPPSLRALPPAAGGARVVHLLGPAPAWLDAALPDIALLIEPDAHQGPARLAAGAPACVTVPLSDDAMLAFSSGLYRALTSGKTIVEAVTAGRAALAGRSTDRWWRPVCWVGDASVVVAPAPLRTLQVPGSWPTCTAHAEQVLSRAAELAQPHGFLGVEHLARALAQQAALPSSVRADLEAIGARLVPPEGGQGLRASPRMLELCQKLSPEFDVEDLVTALGRVHWIARALGPATQAWLARPARAGEPSTWQTPIPPRPAVPGRSLEVIGGPDDGRILSLGVTGQIVGRWDPDRPLDDGARLFSGDGPADRTVSRQHLIYRGNRSFQVRGPTRLQRGGSPPSDVGAEVTVEPGDLLLLGAGTRLMVL